MQKVMKCRYTKCKLGGEVPRDKAVADGSMYYHKSCYCKKEAKAKAYEIMKERFPNKDTNIALSKAVDSNDYPPGLVLYIVENKINKFNNAYGLLYQLKIEENHKEYERIERGRIATEINQAIKSMDIKRDTIEFEYKKSRNRRLDIY